MLVPESLILLSAVILLVVTLFYAWFTFRLLQETRQETSLYKSTLEKQLRLASFPHVYADVQPDLQAGTLHLDVYNVGNIPAYDLLISVIGAYTEEGMDIPTFMRNYIQPRYRKYPLQGDKVGYYGIRSSVRSPLLPIQKKLTLPLSLPVRPVDIYALIQYREIQGGNYYQVYCFSDLDATGNYRANILNPPRFEPMDRVHFYDMDDAKTLPTDKSLPYQVGDFLDLWNHSLSYRFTVLYSDQVTHPQEVHDI